MMVSEKFNRKEAAWKNHIFTGLTADLIFRATIRVIADKRFTPVWLCYDKRSTEDSHDVLYYC